MKEGQKAFGIIFICVFTYLISYILRNLLGVFNPYMTESGLYTATMTATLSSTYMIVYAIGQLVNGTIGDYVKPKYMVLIGLSIVATSLFFFYFIDIFGVQIVCFGFMGFGLSMLRGPLVKTISENNTPSNARIGCMLLSFFSVFGTFITGLFAIIMGFRTAFLTGALIAIGIATISFICISVFEKKGFITYRTVVNKRKLSIGDIFGVFKIRRFIYYLLFAVIVEITASSVTHWLTLYFTEYLGLGKDTASLIYTVISLCRAFCTFICVFLFKLLHENDILLMRWAYGVAIVLFVGVFFVNQPMINVVLLTLSLMSIAVASASIWSVYIPSLGKTGKVSSANGVMDCVGYFGAAGANMLFALIKNKFSWTGLIITWGVIAVLGFVFTLLNKPYDKLESLIRKDNKVSDKN